jgi:hypothetical protein
VVVDRETSLTSVYSHSHIAGSVSVATAYAASCRVRTPLPAHDTDVVIPHAGNATLACHGTALLGRDLVTPDHVPAGADDLISPGHVTPDRDIPLCVEIDVAHRVALWCGLLCDHSVSQSAVLGNCGSLSLTRARPAGVWTAHIAFAGVPAQRPPAFFP